MKKLLRHTFSLAIVLVIVIASATSAFATPFPALTLSFDSVDGAVIVENIPRNLPDGSGEYRVEGYLNYGSERIETFCYGTSVVPFDIPEKNAYIFDYAGSLDFLLPCTGEYVFTAYLTAAYQDADGNMVEEKGPRQSITVYIVKEDESTNWGPGLPETTVETYDIETIAKNGGEITIEEDTYTWTIKGEDIVTVPEENVSLKVTPEPETFDNTGIDEFFGDTVAVIFNIEHEGEFGFKADLDYNVGSEYAGKYANLFHVKGVSDYEFVGGSIVDENGVAKFEMTHASDYVIAITDEEYTGQILNETPADDEVTEPEGSGNNNTLLIGGGIAVVVAAAGIAISKKKK